jgi:hypothetical protein
MIQNTTQKVSAAKRKKIGGILFQLVDIQNLPFKRLQDNYF